MSQAEPSEIHLTLPPQVVQPGATDEERRQIRALEVQAASQNEQLKTMRRAMTDLSKTTSRLVDEFVKFKRYALIASCIIFAGTSNGGTLAKAVSSFFQ